MPKKYQFLLYPLLLNSVLLPPLKADKPLVSPKLIEILRQYKPEMLQEGIELRPSGEELQQALFEGDTSLIQKIATSKESTNIVQNFAEIEVYQSKGAFQEANRQLEICNKNFFQDKNAQDLLSPINGILLTCSQMLIGNYFLEGDIKNWGIELNLIENVYYPAIQKFKGLEKFSLAVTKMGNLTISPDSIPPFTVTGIEQQQSVPLQFQIPIEEIYRRNAEKLPSIIASLNKEDIPFFLETGAAIGKLPTKFSHASNVHLIGHINNADNAASENYSGELGIVEELKIGNATLKNVPFLFTNVNQAYLGLMILQKLGKIKINKQQMTFGKDINCNCQQDIHLGSALGGDFQSVQYPITWQGHTRLVVVDFTQDDTVYNLTTYKSEFTPQEKEQSFEERPDPNNKELKFSVYFNKGNLFVDNMDYGQKKEIVIEDSRSRLATIIGLSILEKADLYLDFINHKACLKPNNSDATPIPQ
ncbi:aspartyl protease family protein [Zymomonas mobilis]|uniref:aspartyl protease family protein n=1 Tax=Zymomonas mobilis TaxID=542 RepID=UPI0039E9BAE0